VEKNHSLLQIIQINKNIQINNNINKKIVTTKKIHFIMANNNSTTHNKMYSESTYRVGGNFKKKMKKMKRKK
jgi:hypothetical protein